MTGAGKVVSKSYSRDAELAEQSNTLQIWSIICLPITKYKLGISKYPFSRASRIYYPYFSIMSVASRKCKKLNQMQVFLIEYGLMTGARKVVSKSYSCDAELVEKSNTLQIQSICYGSLRKMQKTRPNAMGWTLRMGAGKVVNQLLITKYMLDTSR